MGWIDGHDGSIYCTFVQYLTDIETLLSRGIISSGTVSARIANLAVGAGRLEVRATRTTGVVVKRIVPNIAAEKLNEAKAFYRDVLGLQIVMDLGWIVTFAAETKCAPQISFAAEGGSRTPVPDLSIEVDNLDETYKRVSKARYKIEYGPVNEPWGETLLRA